MINQYRTGYRYTGCNAALNSCFDNKYRYDILFHELKQCFGSGTGSDFRKRKSWIQIRMHLKGWPRDPVPVPKHWIQKSSVSYLSWRVPWDRETGHGRLHTQSRGISPTITFLMSTINIDDRISRCKCCDHKDLGQDTITLQYYNIGTVTGTVTGTGITQTHKLYDLLMVDIQPSTGYRNSQSWTNTVPVLWS
jgi:hypothetical protein